MRKKRNLIKHFFIGVTIALITTVVLWGGLIYYYQLSQLPDRIEQGLGTSIDSVALRMRGINDEADFTRRAKILTSEFPLVALEYYRADGTRLYQFYRDDTQEELRAIHDRWHRLMERLHRDSEYFATRNGDRHFLHFSVLIPDNDAHYLDAIMIVPKRQVDNLKRSAMIVLIVTIGSIFITALVLFPLIYFAYRTMKKQKTKLLISNLQTIAALGNAIAKRDSDTDSHNHRVVYYAVKLAESLNMKPEQIRGLIKGSFLHDIGKIGIRDDILLKPGPLDHDMFEVMKRHTILGEEIITDVNWLQDARSIVRHHHERHDGQGYPDGLHGEEIPVNARIFSIVDVFDALTSRRPYKEPFELENSLEIIRKDIGKRFDPVIAERFLELAPTLYEEMRGQPLSVIRFMLINTIKYYFDIPDEWVQSLATEIN
jgi:HD-GYP domain-containing protein (c-di-GMP phosphodiesterase class II)